MYSKPCTNYFLSKIRSRYFLAFLLPSTQPHGLKERKKSTLVPKHLPFNHLSNTSTPGGSTLTHSSLSSRRLYPTTRAGVYTSSVGSDSFSFSLASNFLWNFLLWIHYSRGRGGVGRRKETAGVIQSPSITAVPTYLMKRGQSLFVDPIPSVHPSIHLSIHTSIYPGLS